MLAVGPRSLSGPIATNTFSAYHDGPRGDLLLRYQNDLVTACGPPTCVGAADERAQLYADYRTTTAIAPLFYSAPLLTPNGLRVAHLRGSMTSELLHLPTLRP